MPEAEGAAGAERPSEEEEAEEPGGEPEPAEEAVTADAEDETGSRGRRRGRRGGRRRRREDETLPAVAEPGADQPELPPVYLGPTPANPFGSQGYDIFDVIERAEQQSEFSAASSEAVPSEPAPFATPAEGEPEPEAEPARDAEAERAPEEAARETEAELGPSVEAAEQPVAAAPAPQSWSEPQAEEAPALSPPAADGRRRAAPARDPADHYRQGRERVG